MPKPKEIGADFTQGKILPMLFRFMLPFLLANLLNSLYNTVDAIIIGRFVGSEGILAVSLGGKMLQLFTNVSLAFAGGGQILISQTVGAKRRDQLNSIIGTMFTEMISLSVILAFITLLFSKQILIWLNTPAEAFTQALQYLRITCLGLPLIFGYNSVSSVLRGMGDSKNPLLFIAIAAVVNLIGDVIFIVWFHMGAVGTACATVIGQGVSIAFSLGLLYRKREKFGFDFRPKSFAVNRNYLRIMFRVGYPMALRSCLIVVTQLVLIRFVNLYGVVEAAAYSIGDKIVVLTNVFHMAAKQAAGTMIGQNIGANRPDRVKQIFRKSFVITLSAGLLISGAAWAFPRGIFGLFTTEPEVLAYARVFMHISSLIFMVSAVMAPYDAVITGTGNAGVSLLSGILDSVIFRVGFSFLFSYAFGMGIIGFHMGNALARFGIVIVGGIYYHSGAWARYKKLIG